ncbi:DUF6766 family protein [Streptomyces thermolilacinus]|uniref:DUF6766 family protein n=1 Tax=Streptomyces thermolilacinus TaxID=285540 RepID=UPI0033EE69C7
MTPPTNRFLRFAKDNGLSLVFGAMFLVTVFGQAVAGQAEYNDEMRSLGADPIGFGRYLASADFAVAVTENWQSEYLQFFLYLFGTVYLRQRGSPESKPVGASHDATGVEG